MGTSVLHIKTEVECKVFLFDEEKGIATPSKYFNLEVRKGEQDLLFISVLDQDIQCSISYQVEESDCDYHLTLEESQFMARRNSLFELLSTEVTDEEVTEGTEDNSGVIYSRDGSQLLQCKNKDIASYEVKEGCIVIRESAFRECENLVNITLPIGLTHMGDCVFYECRKLSNITLPSSLTHIGSRPFEFTQIHYIVSESPNYIFSKGCLIDVMAQKLIACLSEEESVDLPEGLMVIDDDAFHMCENLYRITLPMSLTYIGDSAFSGCENLTFITLPMSLTHIGEYAFEKCRKISSINLPHGITQIEEGTFMDCENLFNVTLPDGLTYIGDRAFSNCHNLSNITFPKGLTGIGEYAFSDCSKLLNIILPNGLTQIWEYAFIGCESLSNITLPSTLLRNLTDMYDVF